MSPAVSKSVLTTLLLAAGAATSLSCADDGGDDDCSSIAGEVSFYGSGCDTPEWCVVSDDCSAVCAGGVTTRISVSGDNLRFRSPEGDSCQGVVVGDGAAGTCGSGSDSCTWQADLEREDPNLGGGPGGGTGGGNDAGSSDAGARDAGASDAGARDAGASDAGGGDGGGGRDAGGRDSGASDSGARDAAGEAEAAN